MPRILFSLILFLSLGLNADEPPAEDGKKSAWNVSSDQYYTREVTIDTVEVVGPPTDGACAEVESSSRGVGSRRRSSSLGEIVMMKATGREL